MESSFWFGEKEIQAWLFIQVVWETSRSKIWMLRKPTTRNTQDSAIPFSTQDASTSQPKAVYSGQMRCHALHVVTFSYHSCIKKKECWDSLCFVDPEVSRYPFEWIEFQFWHWFSSYTLKCQPGSTARTSIKELTRFVSSFSSWKSWAPHPPKVFAKLSYKRMQRNVFCHVLPSSRYQMVLSIIYLISSLFALDRFATSSCCISHPHRGDHQLFFGLVRWPIPFNPRSIVEGNFWTRP